MMKEWEEMMKKVEEYIKKGMTPAEAYETVKMEIVLTTR